MTAVKQGRLYHPTTPRCKHGDSRSQEREPVSTLDVWIALSAFSRAYQESKPITRPCVQRFTSIYIHTSHFSKNTEITLQDVPNRVYTLRLFVENVERELQRKDDHTWTPVQRQYVPYFPNTYVSSLTGGRDICPTSQIRAGKAQGGERSHRP